ncbi:MAG TPA: hypothetical protein PKW52_04880 [Nitrospira sp.]|nr:hypothetical protein [Nitrospira sp. NTP1]HQR13255.1 hypothetical protein [Nitrospira sp.]HQV10649.1 hypothetical protein [Nitrospira sp.]
MNKRLHIASMLLTALAVGLFASLAVQARAQVIHPDQMIGAPALKQEVIPEGGVIPNGPALSDLEKGFDRPLMAPETEASGTANLNMLKTPDATDVENARESDSRSAVSF